MDIIRLRRSLNLNQTVVVVTVCGSLNIILESKYRRLTVEFKSKKEIYSSPSLSQSEKDKLAELLEDCWVIKNDTYRRSILGHLPANIRRHITESTSTRIFLSDIINICDQFENGLHHLYRSIQYFEGATRAMRKVHTFLYHKKIISPLT